MIECVAAAQGKGSVGDGAMMVMTSVLGNRTVVVGSLAVETAESDDSGVTDDGKRKGRNQERVQRETRTGS